MAHYRNDRNRNNNMADDDDGLDDRAFLVDESEEEAWRQELLSGLDDDPQPLLPGEEEYSFRDEEPHEELAEFNARFLADLDRADIDTDPRRNDPTPEIDDEGYDELADHSFYVNEDTDANRSAEEIEQNVAERWDRGWRRQEARNKALPRIPLEDVDKSFENIAQALPRGDARANKALPQRPDPFISIDQSDPSRPTAPRRKPLPVPGGALAAQLVTVRVYGNPKSRLADPTNYEERQALLIGDTLVQLRNDHFGAAVFPDKMVHKPNLIYFDGKIKTSPKSACFDAATDRGTRDPKTQSYEIVNKQPLGYVPPEFAMKEGFITSVLKESLNFAAVAASQIHQVPVNQPNAPMNHDRIADASRSVNNFFIGGACMLFEKCFGHRQSKSLFGATGNSSFAEGQTKHEGKFLHSKIEFEKSNQSHKGLGKDAKYHATIIVTETYELPNGKTYEKVFRNEISKIPDGKGKGKEIGLFEFSGKDFNFNRSEKPFLIADKLKGVRGAEVAAMARNMIKDFEYSGLGTNCQTFAVDLCANYANVMKFRACQLMHNNRFDQANALNDEAQKLQGGLQDLYNTFSSAEKAVHNKATKMAGPTIMNAARAAQQGANAVGKAAVAFRKSVSNLKAQMFTSG